MKKTVLALAAILAFAFPSAAQLGYLTDFGLDRESDSLFLKKMNARMDSIRRHRPTVAVVLSGGGAKGAAHIGLLKYLEEIDMPIDMVLGTSMGGLVGGIYAMGYSASQLDSMIRSFDWDLLMSDKISKDYIPFEEKRYRETFLLSVPFHYRESDYNENRTASKRYPKPEQLTFKAGENEYTSRTESNFLSSLPAGYLVGQNIYSVFNSLSVGYHDRTDFADLPIPFVCVATDLVTQRAKYWHEGSIPVALRSTMSIPGLFTPVRTEGMVLVDGGVRRNFPAAAAKSMGADIVIGLAFKLSNVEFGDISNVADVLSAHSRMLTKDDYYFNRTVTDVVVIPDLKDYGTMSFDSEAIDYIIKAGYEAAVEKKDQLMAIKARLNGDGLEKGPRSVIDINNQKVKIGSISFKGFRKDEIKYILNRIRPYRTGELGRQEADNLVKSIYGTGVFESVNYKLIGHKEPFDLEITGDKAPIHKFGIGGKLDTEEAVSLFLNLGLGKNTLLGHSLDISTRVCLNPILDIHYEYRFTSLPTLNVKLHNRWTDWSYLNFENINNRFNMSFTQYEQEAYLSNANWIRSDMNVGIRNSVIRTGGYHLDDLDSYYFEDMQWHDYLTLFFRHFYETMDDAYFPTRGISAGVDYGWTNTFCNDGSVDKSFHTARLEFNAALPFSKNFTLLPTLYARSLIGNRFPLMYANMAGGFTEGRYIDQQIPFHSIRFGVFNGKNTGIAALEGRILLLKRNYLSLRGEYMVDTGDFKNFEHVFGGVVSYGLNTIAGPVSASIGWSSLTGVTTYLSLGYDF